MLGFIKAVINADFNRKRGDVLAGILNGRLAPIGVFRIGANAGLGGGETMRVA